MKKWNSLELIFINKKKSERETLGHVGRNEPISWKPVGFYCRPMTLGHYKDSKSIISQIGELILLNKRPSALSLSVQNQRIEMSRVLENAAEEGLES